MAKGGKDEHRMLFDIRGRRKNVVKVVYAVLAILMGLSLLLVAGPLPFGDIFGSEDASEQASQQFEDQAERIEVKLKKDPKDPALLLTLARTHVNAGNSLAEINPETGAPTLTVESRQQYEKASSTWTEYLKATDEPSPNGGQVMAQALFQLAETSSSAGEALNNVKAAAAAQAIYADARPSVGTLGTLAIYQIFTLDSAAAEKTNEKAKKFASSKSQREALDKQFAEYEKAAKGFEKQIEEEKQLEKAVQEGEKAGGQNSGPIGNPFGGGTSLAE